MSSNSSPGNSNNIENAEHSNAPSPIENLGARLRNLDMDSIRRYLAAKLGLHEEVEVAAPAEKVLDEVNLDGIVRWMQGPRCRRVITLAGAGISTSAGIPDFRSPETGLYNNLQKYNLPEPQAIFEINFFRQNPKPFFTLAKELFPGNFKPTVSHYFIRLLHEKGFLMRHYTQNIDTLERGAGIPGEKLVEAHGTFYTSHCLECRKEYPLEWIKERIFAEEIPICTDCPGVVKPDIVFFGESLPDRFQSTLQEDFHQCDLLIIMGSSLEVQPFASLVDMVPDWCPRLLINREKAGMRSPILRMFGLSSGGLQFDESSVRDVARLGDCDDGCLELADRLGWGEELRNLVAREHARLDMAGGFAAPLGAPHAGSGFASALPSLGALPERELLSHLPADISRHIHVPAPPTHKGIPTINAAEGPPIMPALMDHSALLQHSQTSHPTEPTASAIGSVISQLSDTERLIPSSLGVSQTLVPMDHTSSSDVPPDSLPHLPDIADLHRLIADQPALQKADALVSQTNSTEGQPQ